MDNIVVIVISFLIILILLVFLVYKYVQNKKGPTAEPKDVDYKTFFIIGACFLPAGIAISLSSGQFAYNGLSALGFIYLIYGLANKDKWKDK